jgi:hypothetical protein
MDSFLQIKESIMGWLIDIEILDRAFGITLFSVFHIAFAVTDTGIAATLGMWKLLTYISLEWRSI